MSRRMVSILVSLLLLSITATVAAADQKLELAAPFTDNKHCSEHCSGALLRVSPCFKLLWVESVFDGGADAGEFSGKFKLALLQKGWILCQEVTVQGLRARVPVQAGVWVEAKDKVEAGWADLMPQGRAVIAYVRAVAQQPLMLRNNLVMQKVVLNVVRE